MTEKYVQNLHYNNDNYPDSQYRRTKNPATFDFERPNREVIRLNSLTTEPYQYLAQILNAVYNGKKLLVSHEQAELFRDKTLRLLTAEYKPGCLDVCAIKKLSNSAYKFYKDNRKRNVERKPAPAKKYIYVRGR